MKLGAIILILFGFSVGNAQGICQKLFLSHDFDELRQKIFEASGSIGLAVRQSRYRAKPEDRDLHSFLLEGSHVEELILLRLESAMLELALKGEKRTLSVPDMHDRSLPDKKVDAVDKLFRELIQNNYSRNFDTSFDIFKYSVKDFSRIQWMFSEIKKSDSGIFSPRDSIQFDVVSKANQSTMVLLKRAFETITGPSKTEQLQVIEQEISTISPLIQSLKSLFSSNTNLSPEQQKSLLDETKTIEEFWNKFIRQNSRLFFVLKAIKKWQEALDIYEYLIQNDLPVLPPKEQ